MDISNLLLCKKAPISSASRCLDPHIVGKRDYYNLSLLLSSSSLSLIFLTFFN